jgi:hypothetical protein
VLRVPGEDDLPPGHPAQLGQPAARAGPVVDGHHRHRGVEGPLREGELLRRSPDLDRPRVLVEHDLCGVDGGDVRVFRLVGAGPGTDVDHRAGLAQRLLDERGKPGAGSRTCR